MRGTKQWQKNPQQCLPRKSHSEEKFLMIGISEYSTATMSDAGVQLVENACRYLLGMDITSEVDDVHAKDYNIIQQGKCLSVISEEPIRSVVIYSQLGRRIISVDNHSSLFIPQGVYILEIMTDNGKKHYQKLLWR